MLFITLILVCVAISLLLVIIMGIFYFIDLFLELPYVGAKKESIKNIMKLANIKKGETIIDLGSGDGRLLFKASALGATAHGFEINPFLLLISRVKKNLRGQNNRVMIHNQSMWEADLKSADVIFVYSLVKKMQKFEDFIYKNAKKGTRIIVNTNQFPNKKPQKILGKIYLYKI